MHCAMYCSVQCSEKGRLQCSVEFIERCAVECSVQGKVAVASPGPKVGGVGRCSRRVAGSGPALYCTLCNVQNILHSVNCILHCKHTTHYTQDTIQYRVHCTGQAGIRLSPGQWVREDCPGKKQT